MMNQSKKLLFNRRSLRIRGYDYSLPGLYYITICCHNRACIFGDIVSSRNDLPVLQWNDAGYIANKLWLGIPSHFPNARLHAHVIMPNHIHGIIELLDTNHLYVGVEDLQPLQDKNDNHRLNEYQRIIPRSIGSIVRGYKAGVTNWFRAHSFTEKVWQRNYYEHIIRNEKSYQNISAYIVSNPDTWIHDEFYIM